MHQEKHQRRILCLWLPCWPIQRLVVDQPQLKRRRVALFRQDSRRGHLIAAVSPLAQRDGVQIDMPLSEAKSLLWQGARKNATNIPPSASSTLLESEKLFHILPHDPTADLYAIEKLVDDMDSFSPIIGLQTDTPQPDCIFLDVTGLAPLFGSEFDLAKGVFDFCGHNGYLPRVAIADTIGQSQGFAQFGIRNAECETEAPTKTHTQSQQEYKPEVQKSGSSKHTQPLTPANTHTPNIPHSALRIPHSPTSYLSLPVAALRLENWITQTLYQLGIRDVGQLLKLPRRDLTARFGKGIHTRVDQLIGTAPEPIVARQNQSEFYAEQLLDYPTGHMETIEVILQRLIEKICKQMKARQLGALQWTIRMYCQDNKLPLKLYVNLFQPTATAEHVVQLAQMQMEQMLQHTTKKRKNRKNKFVRIDGQNLAVQEITVTVTSSVLLEHHQRKLFDENPRLDKQSLTHLINRLSSRLGRQNVVYPSMISGAQPEHAFQLKPLVNPYGRGPRRTAHQPKTSSQSHTLARPFKLFRPPVPLQTNNNQDRPPAKSAPPSSIHFESTTHQLTQSWGPERIETGWWRGRTVRRDYWRVETSQNQQFWIYHDLRRRQWFLQGEF